MSRGKVHSIQDGRAVASDSHVVEPATASEIRKTLGISKARQERVQTILRNLEAIGLIRRLRRDDAR